MAYKINEVTTKRQSRFYILSIVISVFLSLLALISYFSGASSVLSGIVSIVVSPLNEAGAFLSDKVISIGDYFGDIAELKAENRALKAENNELVKENARIDSIRAENEELYSYLELKREYNSLSLVNAKIITKGSGNFITSFTIDKGTIHGVKKNMPIICSSGIVGIVTEEGPMTSRCISLISHNSSAGIYLVRTGTPGILRNDYKLSLEGKCKVTGIPVDTDVQVGDPIKTSGAGEIYPRDLDVGIVSEIQRDSNSQTLTLIITPGCDLINVDSVMVITDYEHVYKAQETQVSAPEEQKPSE